MTNSTPADVNYDESKVPTYTLPDPLVCKDGTPVTDAATWAQKRRPELLRLFAENVYGITPIGRPEGMVWEVIAEDRNAIDGKGITKTVTLYLTGGRAGEPCTRMNLYMTLPRTDAPVPVFLVAGYGFFGKLPTFNEPVFNGGYGIVYAEIQTVQKDDANAYATSIRRYFAPEGQAEPTTTDWGALAAWAWALSRAMDYLETDPDIDPKRVCVYGFSRCGKAAVWAGAQDERFAITFSGESGCGGVALLRRRFGETIRRITTTFPHWFGKRFADYGDDAVDHLPVDAHELIALHAPRPFYIATAEDDLWGDPHGSFLAGVHAAPVYALFGKLGLETNEEPSINTAIGHTIGFHKRTGKHGEEPYDWEQFVNFADKYFGISQRPTPLR